jgi:ligand-binding sensor domain-containing protein
MGALESVSKIKRTVAAALGLTLAAAGAMAVEPTRQQAPAAIRLEPRWSIHATWRQSDGLPQDTVISILQSRDGYVWVGTRGGLSRFDGVTFTNFSDRAPGQLRQNEVWALAEGEDRSLWVGTYGGGLSRLEHGRFKTVGAADGLVSDFVRVLAVDTAGALWIGTDHGLSRLRDGQIRNYVPKEALVASLHADEAGGVWVGTKQGGLHHVVGGDMSRVELPEPRPVAIIDALCRDRRGVLWMGGADGLISWDGKSTRRYTAADGLSDTRVRRLHMDLEGRLWAVTDQGLDLVTSGPAGATFSTELRGTRMWTLQSDREGGIWLGYRGTGLARVHRGTFTNFGAEEGLASIKTYTVLEDRKGAMWMGTGVGVSALRRGRFQNYGPESGLPVGPVSSVAEDPHGRLWVGYELLGVFRSRGPVGDHPPGRVRFEAVAGPPAIGQIRVLYTDRRGAMWVGTDMDGLVRYEGDRVTTYTTREGLTSGAIRALVESADGSLWIGTKQGGLNRLKDGRFTCFTTKDGLPHDSVQALYLDREDTLWIGTRGGIVRYRDGRFTSYTSRHGLYSSHVYGLVEDNRGDLWMSSGQGMFRVSKRELADFAAGRTSSIRSIAYGREHGMASSVGSVGHDPVAWKSRDGRLWFATEDGLVSVDPAALVASSFSPPVNLEEVVADGEVLDPARALQAPPGHGDLVFRYTAPSFRAPEKVRFRYKLVGFDQDWVAAGSRRVAYYTNLPPGRYSFQVMATNDEGAWSSRLASVQVRLAPHFYQTYWFYSGLVLAVVLGAVGAHRWRVRSLEARERDLSAAVAEAVAQVKVLSGLLPICASCKMIRDDAGYWTQMEAYIHAHSEAQFSHGICPGCAEHLYPGFARRKEAAAAAAGAAGAAVPVTTGSD